MSFVVGQAFVQLWTTATLQVRPYKLDSVIIPIGLEITNLSITKLILLMLYINFKIRFSQNVSLYTNFKIKTYLKYLNVSQNLICHSSLLNTTCIKYKSNWQRRYLTPSDKILNCVNILNKTVYQLSNSKSKPFNAN